MGMSPSAHLIYGYDLGGEETGWNFKDEDRRYEPRLPWLDYDPTQSIPMRLLECYGMSQEDAEDKWCNEDIVKAETGLDFFWFGHLEHTRGYALAAFSIECNGYGPVPVQIPRLGEHAERDLAFALKALRFEHAEPRPRWLLMTSYG